MITVAIDIGLTGAIAAVDSRGTCVINDLATVVAEENNSKGRRRLCGRSLVEQLRAMVPAGEHSIVVIEDVQARPEGNGGRSGNSLQSQGSLMRSRGIVEGALDALRIHPTVVQPQVWKRFYSLIKKDKGESLAVARTLYPSAGHLLKRVKDHNRGEALLIAHWAQRTLT